jgi:hypothetical protein
MMTGHVVLTSPELAERYHDLPKSPYFNEIDPVCGTHFSQPWLSKMTYLPPFFQACISNVNIEEYFRGDN